jgi:hypothetical protein
LCGLGATTLDNNHFVDDYHIKVFLFAHPAFWSQVAVDAPKDICVDLDNNLLVPLRPSPYVCQPRVPSHKLLLGSMVVWNPR